MANKKKDNDDLKSSDKNKDSGDVYNIHEGATFIKVDPNGIGIQSKIESGGINKQNIENNFVFNINGEKLDPKFLSDLSTWIKTQRKKKSLTQQDLSEKARISVKYLQKLESTKILILPRIDTLQKIAYVLGSRLRLNFGK